MDEKKILVIMRGLPGSGKSYAAKQVLEMYALSGMQGVIHSTDEYFFTVLKPEKPEEYSWNPRFIGDAHRWNRVRTQAAIENNITPIIIDNTNVTAQEPKAYVEYALPQDYEVLIQEPTSSWWLEIRDLLLDRKKNKKKLKDWAVELANNKTAHNVPFYSIERMMWRWDNNLTVDDILNAQEKVY